MGINTYNNVISRLKPPNDDIRPVPTLSQATTLPKRVTPTKDRLSLSYSVYNSESPGLNSAAPRQQQTLQSPPRQRAPTYSRHPGNTSRRTAAKTTRQTPSRKFILAAIFELRIRRFSSIFEMDDQSWRTKFTPKDRDNIKDFM